MIFTLLSTGKLQGLITLRVYGGDFAT